MAKGDRFRIFAHLRFKNSALDLNMDDEEDILETTKGKTQLHREIIAWATNVDIH
jgi:hypothetical protein